jgi:hypothetical protein
MLYLLNKNSVHFKASTPFLAYFPKMKVGLSYHPLITLNQSVEFYEIWFAGDAVEYDLDAILFNLVASVIPKWRTFKLLRWVQRHPLLIFEPLVDLDDILSGDDGIEGDLDPILLNAVASIITKWRAFKLLRWVQFLNRLVDLDEILYGGYGIGYCLL